MERISFEPFLFSFPDFADEFVWGEAFERLEPACKIVGGDEVCEVAFEVGVIVVVVAFDGRILDRAVHSLDLSVRPRMLGRRSLLWRAPRRLGGWPTRRHPAW